MFEQAFKNIDSDLRNEAGCTTELDYTEQTSWLLFLKYLDGLEQDKAMEAELEGKKYTFILDEPYRWSSWAAPKDKDGKLDHNKAQTGDDLREFVDRKLFPYLHGFKQKASGPNTIEYKIGEIFGEIKNKIQSGYTLREIIDHIDELRFRSQAEKHELSHLYEAKIKNMGNAGRNGGEYYTPRPLIRAMVQVIQPKVGERIYDGACGSAGFLCESFDYLRQQPKLTADNLKTLQERTFYGKEKKPLAYVIAIMNMILHGIEAPNIIHTNTLTENLADIQDKDRMDVILANPPFGGGERKEVQQNFPIRTGETAFLFLQHFIKMLKAGGRAAVVIKNTFLSNTDNASVSLRKLLLESCNLHTILDLPTGVFQGTTVRTVVLFFEKGAPTRKIWIYRLDPGRPLGKTTPLNDEDLRDFLTSQAAFDETANSWFVNVNDLDATTHEIPIKNGESNTTLSHQTPQVLIGRLHRISSEGSKVVGGIAKLLENHEGSGLGNKSVRTLGELCNFYRGLTYSKSDEVEVSNNIVLRATNIDLSSNSLDLTELRYISDSVVVPESKKVRKDALIICTASGSKSHLGKVAYIDDDLDYAFGGFMGMLVPKPELLPKYLFYYMTSPAYKDFIASLSDGANINNLKFDDLKKFRISCPSLLEQKRIVDELDLLTDEAKRLESLYRDELAVLEALKSSSLHFAFQ